MYAARSLCTQLAVYVRSLCSLRSLRSLRSLIMRFYISTLQSYNKNVYKKIDSFCNMHTPTRNPRQNQEYSFFNAPTQSPLFNTPTRNPTQNQKRSLPNTPSPQFPKIKRRRQLNPDPLTLKSSPTSRQSSQSPLIFPVNHIFRTPIRFRYQHFTNQSTNLHSPSNSPTTVKSYKFPLYADIFKKTRAYTCNICHGRHPSNRCPTKEKPCSSCGEQGHDRSSCPLIIQESIQRQLIQEKKNSMKDIFPPSRSRGKLLTGEEKHMAIRVYYEVLTESAVKLVPTKHPFLRTCNYTGLSKNTLREIINEWKLNQEFATMAESGRYNRNQKAHWSRLWISDIRTIINQLNCAGEPVTVRKILKRMNTDYLNDYGLQLTRNTCTRLLHRMGFNFDKVSKTQNVVETSEIKLWREKYLQHRDDIKESRPNAIELWQDESYCNQHYVGKRSWFRPGDIVRRGNRGRRWVIIHCGGADGWVGDSFIFEANSGEADYHKNMNATTFENYFTNLCSKILSKYPEDRVRNDGVYIYMDNAAYHKRVEGLQGGISKLKKKGKFNNYLNVIKLIVSEKASLELQLRTINDLLF
jgi:hypothetical protein